MRLITLQGGGPYSGKRDTDPGRLPSAGEAVTRTTDLSGATIPQSLATLTAVIKLSPKTKRKIRKKNEKKAQ